ncbi:Nse4 domain containing protein [Pyrenophora tritici-repentis]|nr:Nse4 domain containing protein [Pyrenophora tritici-repentis]
MLRRAKRRQGYANGKSVRVAEGLADDRSRTYLIKSALNRGLCVSGNRVQAHTPSKPINSNSITSTIASISLLRRFHRQTSWNGASQYPPVCYATNTRFHRRLPLSRPSVGPQNGDNERTSSYSVLSPSRSSDKENETPGMREKTPRGKSGGLRGASARMPTPDSGSTSGNGSKRRRTDNYSLPQSQVYEDGQDEEEQAEEGDDLEAVDTPTQTQPDNDDEEHSRFYDPHQDPEVRRRLRANMRDHARLLEDNRNDLIQSRNSGLLDILKTQNSLFGKVRQTADATVDSRFLVNASDLAGKKLNNSLGNSATGIDLDQFVSKCIYFMKSGGYVAGEENAPVIPVGDDDNEDPDGLDWALLGRQACFPCNKRPPTSAFLLGPLSVQKRVRTTQRKARSQRQPLGPATRPQEITQNDTQQSEANNLTTSSKASGSD